MTDISKRNQIIFNAALFILSVACVIASYILINNLHSQKAAERYKGEGSISYAQVSIFLPATTSFNKDSVNKFRTNIYDALKSGVGEDKAKFIDAFSCVGNVKISSDRSNATVQAIAVDGNFFDFHPLQLLSGSYITDDDKDINRIVVDEELAWLLFGSNDIAGMSVNIGEEVFYIAGVVDREDDTASKKAFNESMGLFMTYTAYKNVSSSGTSSNNTENAGSETSSSTTTEPAVTCYEIVLPNIVNNYGYNLVQEKFTEKNCEIIQNTTRFSFKNILTFMKDPAARVIASSGIAYPYWENAARYVESKVASLIQIALILIVLPIIAFLVYTTKNAVWTTKKVKNDIAPKAKDKAEEYVRKKERKHWEKKHKIDK